MGKRGIDYREQQEGADCRKWLKGRYRGGEKRGVHMAVELQREEVGG